MKWSARWGLLALMLSATSCASGGPGTRPGCEWAKPIFVSRSDVLTDRTAAEILEHNKTWVRICG